MLMKGALFSSCGETLVMKDTDFRGCVKTQLLKGTGFSPYMMRWK